MSPTIVVWIYVGILLVFFSPGCSHRTDMPMVPCSVTDSNCGKQPK